MEDMEEMETQKQKAILMVSIQASTLFLNGFGVGWLNLRGSWPLFHDSPVKHK